MSKQNLSKNKLLKLKEWLTVLEAARHLSNLFDESVSEADVLRLGLDGHLKLSVNFVNQAHARRGGKFIPFEEWEQNFRKMLSWQNAKTLAGIEKDDTLIKDNEPWSFGPKEQLKNIYPNKQSPEDQAELLSNATEKIIAYQHKQSEKFDGKVPPSTDSFEEKVLTIDGVWDLPMLGNERIDIEHKYQMLTGGPGITLIGFDGAFVENKDGIVCQVQEVFDKEWIESQNSEEAKQKSLDFYRKFLDKRIANNEIDEKEAEKLLGQRRENLDKPKSYDNRFYPAGGLPEDSVVVVRTKALIDLQERLSQADSKKNTSLDSRSETTYLNIIGAMLETFIHKDHGDVDFPSETKLREFLSKKYAGFKGLTERTLAEKFSAAKKAIREESD